jgi:hypothetical protein
MVDGTLWLECPPMAARHMDAALAVWNDKYGPLTITHPQSDNNTYRSVVKFDTLEGLVIARTSARFRKRYIKIMRELHGC